MIQIDLSKLQQFVSVPYEMELAPRLHIVHGHLQKGNGVGGEFTGWVHLPESYDRAEFARIEQAAQKIRSDSQALVVIGIGGSYLGARGVIECLCSPNYNLKKKDTPNIYFIGNGLSSDQLSETMELLDGVDFSVNVISKSGTTTEPAVAFRFFRRLLEERYGKEGAAARNEADDVVFVEVVGEGLRDPVETVGLDLQRLVIGDGLVFLLHAYPSFYRYFSTARGQWLVKYLHFCENFSCRGAKILPIPIFRPV